MRNQRMSQLLSFSILYRIEPTVTANPTEREKDKTGFQYPLSDRTHCNYAPKRTPHAPSESFSILYRIEPTVTTGTGTT